MSRSGSNPRFQTDCECDCERDKPFQEQTSSNFNFHKSQTESYEIVRKESEKPELRDQLFFRTRLKRPFIIWLKHPSWRPVWQRKFSRASEGETVQGWTRSMASWRTVKVKDKLTKTNKSTTCKNEENQFNSSRFWRMETLRTRAEYPNSLSYLVRDERIRIQR